MATQKNDFLNFMLGLTGLVLAICLLLALKLAQNTGLPLMTVLKPVGITVVFMPILAFCLWATPNAKAFAWFWVAFVGSVLWYAWWPVTITLGF